MFILPLLLSIHPFPSTYAIIAQIYTAGKGHQLTKCLFIHFLQFIQFRATATKIRDMSIKKLKLCSKGYKL